MSPPPRRSGGQGGPAPRRGRPPERPRPGGDRRPTRSDAELGGEQVEGRQAVRELLLAGRRRVRQLLVGDLADASRGGPLAELVELAAERSVPVRHVGRGELLAQAGTDAPQGVIARADPVEPVDLDALLRAAGPPPLLVVLDGVTDPHNLGAVLRSALAAGATGVVVGRHRSAHLGPAAVKAAAGAAEHLPIAVVAGIPAALSQISGAGVWTAGLDADGPTSLWELPVASAGVALVLGAEGAGLSRLVRDRCELLVRVPMTGPLASLNVSATAALACFEVARQRAVGAPPH